MKLVQVTWLDSHSMVGWESREEVERWVAERGLTCKSAGYLLAETDEYIVLVMSHSAEMVNNVMKIPRVAVKQIDLCTPLSN